MNTDQTAPIFPPGHPDAPPQPVQKPPPGMAWGIAPSGERVLAYLPPEAEKPVETAAPQRDVWPMRLATGFGGTAALAAAVGYAGPGLGQAGHAIQMAGIGVGITTVSVGALVALVKGSLARQAGQKVEVNVNVSNTVTATAKSRSGRRR